MNGGLPVETTRVVVLLRHRREGDGRHKAGLYTEGQFMVSLSNRMSGAGRRSNPLRSRPSTLLTPFDIAHALRHCSRPSTLLTPFDIAQDERKILRPFMPNLVPAHGPHVHGELVEPDERGWPSFQPSPLTPFDIAHALRHCSRPSTLLRTNGRFCAPSCQTWFPLMAPTFMVSLSNRMSGAGRRSNPLRSRPSTLLTPFDIAQDERKILRPFMPNLVPAHGPHVHGELVEPDERGWPSFQPSPLTPFDIAHALRHCSRRTEDFAPLHAKPGSRSWPPRSW